MDMKDRASGKVDTFDTMFTNNHIQMLKILLPYLELSHQKNLAIYIKYLELQYTLAFFKSFPNLRLSPLQKSDVPDLEQLCDEFSPYLSSTEKKRFDGMRQMYQTFANFQDMMEMIQMMKELFPESEGGFSPDMLSSLGSMTGMENTDLSQLFSMFQGKGPPPDQGQSPPPPAKPEAD